MNRYVINFELDGKLVLPTAYWRHLPKVDDIIMKGDNKYVIMDIEYNYDEYNPTVTLQLEEVQKAKEAVKE